MRNGRREEDGEKRESLVASTSNEGVYRGTRTWNSREQCCSSEMMTGYGFASVKAAFLIALAGNTQGLGYQVRRGADTDTRV